MYNISIIYDSYMYIAYVHFIRGGLYPKINKGARIQIVKYTIYDFFYIYNIILCIGLMTDT